MMMTRFLQAKPAPLPLPPSLITNTSFCMAPTLLPTPHTHILCNRSCSSFLWLCSVAANRSRTSFAWRLDSSTTEHRVRYREGISGRASPNGEVA